VPRSEEHSERPQFERSIDSALLYLDLDLLLGQLLVRTRDAFGADTCAVLLLDEVTAELVVRAGVGVDEGVRIPAVGGRAGDPAVSNPILGERGIESLLGAPLAVEGRVLGVLQVGTRTPRQFSGEETELLQIIGDCVAIAIERAMLHEETVRLDQVKASFIAIASHELRTPATSVYGILATLVERGHELAPEMQQELLRIGYEQGDRLRRLLEELLDLSRLDARAIALDPKPIVLHSVVSSIAAQALPPDIPLELDVADDLAAVADPLVLDRVLSNLLINAARYGAPPIVVRAERRDRHLVVAVQDHGPGVPEELRSHLFDRFARGASGGGSGLGLAIARSYARAHGGDVIYHPDESGARFELIVPQD
jgi:signal transduction histidine kinase